MVGFIPTVREAGICPAPVKGTRKRETRIGVEVVHSGESQRPAGPTPRPPSRVARWEIPPGSRVTWSELRPVKGRGRVYDRVGKCSCPRDTFATFGTALWRQFDAFALYEARSMPPRVPTSAGTPP